MNYFQNFSPSIHRVALNRYVFVFLLFLTGGSFLWTCTQPKLFFLAATLFLFQFFFFFPVREFFSKVNFQLRCERTKKSFKEKKPVFISTFTIALYMGLSLIGIFSYALLVSMCMLLLFFVLMFCFWIFPPKLFSAKEEEDFWK